jgi:uncharacterized protein (TIGR02453 family)
VGVALIAPTQEGQTMPASRPKVTSNGRINSETFRFFRDLSCNNAKEWMDENRELYQSSVVQPPLGLLEELTPAVRKLYPGFDVSGRTGVNFSRINRDIRFAKDKTPYRPQMYLIFPPRGGKRRGADLCGVPAFEGKQQ